MSTVSSSPPPLQPPELVSHPAGAPARRRQRRELAPRRELVAVALDASDLPPAHLTLRSSDSNATFRRASAAGPRAVLRVHRVGDPTVNCNAKWDLPRF